MVFLSAAVRQVEGQDKQAFMVMVPLGMMLQPGMRATIYPKDLWEKAKKNEKIDESKLKPLSLAYSLWLAIPRHGNANAPRVREDLGALAHSPHKWVGSGGGEADPTTQNLGFKSFIFLNAPTRGCQRRWRRAHDGAQVQLKGFRVDRHGNWCLISVGSTCQPDCASAHQKGARRQKRQPCDKSTERKGQCQTKSCASESRRMKAA